MTSRRPRADDSDREDRVLLEWIRHDPWVFIGIFVVAGGVLHMLAWTELDEINLVDIFMRGLPFEDLSSTGQMLEIASWILGALAILVVLIVFVTPRLPP